MNRVAPALALVVVATAILVGCTQAQTYTADRADIANTAENALEEQVGARPDIDCGEGSIDLVKGTVLDCVLTDPATGDQYESPVTIESVDGANYTIGIQVADAPIAG